MNGIQAFIGGIEVVSNKTFSIKEEMLKTSSTILNNCYPLSWESTHDYYSNFFFPQDYSNCEITKNGILIFAGLVKNSGDISLRPQDPKYCSLQILDYKALLSEGLNLEFVINNKTITEAIQMVIDAISDYGFVSGNIVLDNPNEIIGAYSTLNKTPYDIFQYFAEITQSRWFTRMVDSSTVAIDFYSPDSMPRANDIEYTTEYFENNNIVNISWNFGTRDYRNKQIVVCDEIFGNIDTNENVTANGYQNTYTSSQNIGVLKEVYIGGISKTIGTTDEKKLGIYADFYYSPGTNTLESSDNYVAGTVINIIYTPLIKGRQIVYNNNEINRVGNQINRNGTLSRYETRNDILSSNELFQVAQTYIQYKGKAEILLTIETKDTDILNVGQQVYFDIPNLPQLQKDYMVKSKEIEITQTGEFGVVFYKYVLTSNYNSDSAINYFDNQRRKTNGNISESEFITRNVDIENDTNIVFNNLETTEIQPIGNNILNSTLDSPFVS